MFLFVGLAQGYVYSTRLALFPFCPIIPAVAVRLWIKGGQVSDPRLRRQMWQGTLAAWVQASSEISELEQAYLTP